MTDPRCCIMFTWLREAGAHATFVIEVADSAAAQPAAEATAGIVVQAMGPGRAIISVMTVRSCCALVTGLTGCCVKSLLGLLRMLGLLILGLRRTPCAPADWGPHATAGRGVGAARPACPDQDGARDFKDDGWGLMHYAQLGK